MPTETYSIADLARLTGVNVRTIRYYLAQGLLPASGESGPGAHYGEGHLDRLRLTKRLQAQHLPLAEIRRRLAELSDTDVAGLVATTNEPAAAPATSALEYVRGLLGASFAEHAIPMPTTASTLAARAVPAAPSGATPAATGRRGAGARPAPAPDDRPSPICSNGHRIRAAASGIGRGALERGQHDAGATGGASSSCSARAGNTCAVRAGSTCGARAAHRAHRAASRAN